jgi:hypothetical protein
MTAAFLLRHWRILALLACVLGLFWFGYHTKAKIDAREAAVAELERMVAEKDEVIAGLMESRRLQEAANAASKAAGDRNDAVLPKTRRETAGRVERAPVADAATELRDDQEAIAAYESAAGRLQGTRPR